MRRSVERALLFIAVSVGLGAHGATLTRTSAFEYDPASGFLSKEIIEPDNPNLCLVTTYAYDAYGNRIGVTTRNCNGSSSEAAAPTGDAVFASRTSTSAFGAGSIAIGGVTWAWGTGQFSTTVTNVLAQSETKAFDPRFGAVALMTGPNGLSTSWTYDSFGRNASESRVDGTSTTWTYTRCVDGPGTCPSNAVYFTVTTNTGAPQSRSFLDSLNREIRNEKQGFDGTWVRKDTIYDSLGRIAQVSKPYYANASPVWTTYTYDALGRATQVDEPSVGSNTARTATSFNGLTTSVTASNAGAGTNMPGGVVQTKTATKNSQGQVVAVTDTQNNIIAYTYDPFGNLLATNAGGVTTALVYDLRGRKTSMSDPDMGSWSYVYNALGELIRQTDAKSQTTGMTYDLLGRMTARSEADLVSTWVYDSCTKGIGKLCSASTDNGYSRTQSYDSLGRPSILTVTVDTAHAVTTSYDSVGRVDTTTYPTGYAVQNVYNGYGYLWKIQRVNDPDTTVYWTAVSQSAAGGITSELLGSGLTTARTYDVLHRTTGIASSNAGGAVQNLAYSFDAVGNVAQRQELTQSVTENFAYDNLNRLISASGPGLTTRSFDYSAIGNMLYKSDVGTYTYPTVTSARPHAVSSITGGGSPYSVTASYTYDANGNLTSGSGTLYPASGSVTFGRTLTYASFNMPGALTHVQGASTYSYTYTYNPEHERVKLITARPDDILTSIYLHPGGKGALLYEKVTRVSDGRVEHSHYVNGGAGVIGVFVTKSAYQGGEAPEMRYYHRDHLGSVVAITNPAAAVIERLAFEAYGERRHASGSAQDRSSPLVGVSTDRGFTAHEHLDEMMLVHMNGRIYDPIVGRFMTADPFLQAPEDLQTYNRMSYVRGNPLLYRDPTGYLSLRRFVEAVRQVVIYPAASMLLSPVSAIPTAINYARGQIAGVQQILDGNWSDGAAILMQSNNYFAMRTAQYGFVNSNPGVYMASTQMSGLGNVVFGSRQRDSFGNTGRPGIYGILNRPGGVVDAGDQGNQVLALPFDVNDVFLGYSGVPSASGMDYARRHRGEKPVGHSLGALDSMNLVSYGLTPGADVYAPPGGVAAPYGVNVTIGRYDWVNSVPLSAPALLSGDFIGAGLSLTVSGYLEQGINPTASVRHGKTYKHSRGCYGLDDEPC